MLRRRPAGASRNRSRRPHRRSRVGECDPLRGLAPHAAVRARLSALSQRRAHPLHRARARCRLHPRPAAARAAHQAAYAARRGSIHRRHRRADRRFRRDRPIGLRVRGRARRRRARRPRDESEQVRSRLGRHLATRRARKRRAVVRRDPGAVVQHQHARVGRGHSHDRRLREPLSVRARRALRVPWHQQRFRSIPLRLPPPLDLAVRLGRELRLRAVCDRALRPGNDSTQFKAGADITWKVSPNLWLGATLNPDFGQVESDELVVDFSAIETVFTDKRPFFTENQGIFDLRTPTNGQLIYTRRIGAAPDDFSEGSSDIDVAVKLTGTANSLVYGAFMAQERDYRDDFGRLFAASRVALPLRGRAHRLPGHLDRPSPARSRRRGQRDRLRADAERLVARVGAAHPLRHRPGRDQHRRLRSVAADGLQPLCPAHAHPQAPVHRRPFRPERPRLHGAQLAAPGRVGHEPPGRRRRRGPHQRRKPAPVCLLPRKRGRSAPAIAPAAIAHGAVRERLDGVPGAALSHERRR